MKKILKYVLCLFIIFVPLIVKADDIYNIDMHVNIDQYGTASIEETWDVKADNGSEWYKYYANMENIELSNYEVYMDGTLMNFNSNWNIHESLSKKSGSYGINYKSDGFELCFGKSDFNRHKFTLKYKLSNMIFNVDDAQTLYFTFLPRITVDNYNIIIDSYYEFPDTLDVWGYGAKGYAYVENGKIIMSNEGKVYSNYVTLLVKFPQNTFEIINSYDRYKTFDDVFTKAEENTYNYDYKNDSNTYRNTEDIVMGFVGLIIIIIAFTLIIIVIKKVIKHFKRKSDYGYKDNKKINKKNTPMFREIPCNKDIFYANALIKLNDPDHYKDSSLFGAILLKWLMENKIKLVSDKSDKLKKKTTKIDLTNGFVPNENTNSYEMILFTFLYEVSEKGILELKDLKEMGYSKLIKFSSILEKFTNTEISKLKKEHHIYNNNYLNKKLKYKYIMDDKLYEESKELYGLKLFLEKFSKINDKEAIEVKLWEEYLMFAYLFGIADKVMKQFEKLYPDVIENIQKRNIALDVATISFINNISISSVSAATSAKSSGSSSGGGSSYSSGGGGFSSGGGGGGSFGGGGSAGGR